MVFDLSEKSAETIFDIDIVSVELVLRDHLKATVILSFANNFKVNLPPCWFIKKGANRHRRCTLSFHVVNETGQCIPSIYNILNLRSIEKKKNRFPGKLHNNITCRIYELSHRLTHREYTVNHHIWRNA